MLMEEGVQCRETIKLERGNKDFGQTINGISRCEVGMRFDWELRRWYWLIR